ncbi:hypothetical protein CSA37_08195 [Candidatus Fermentibacteria bacterium]|nr:MAG: hypothetical protein CSA37_08195 [Candidatus Fermentibacteria bacterium]
MNRELSAKYADVILGGALAITEGQRLWIRSEPVHALLVKQFMRTAYKMGAQCVRVTYEDPEFSRIRADHSVKESYLDFVPGFTAEMYRTTVEEGWRSLALRGPSNPDVMQGVDPGRISRMTKAGSAVRQEFMKAISSNKNPWNVCLAPTESWSEKVLGSAVDWEKRIWEVLTPILRLDTPDPALAWREQDRELKRRAGFLNSKKYSSFRFRGPGTDLTIGMLPDRKFAGGSCSSSDGTVFFPNIPTEEVFSTPDMFSAEGRAACTRPVTVLGAQVEGAWFQFSQGKVTDCGARKNGEILNRYIATDEGSSRLGEIAFVGTDSPIYRSGLVFHNILFDENAACHIALGNGYTDCIEGGTEMNDEELKKVHCNRSLVHTDFMVGGEDVDVYGVTENGSEEPVITRGEFVI